MSHMICSSYSYSIQSNRLVILYCLKFERYDIGHIILIIFKSSPSIADKKPRSKLGMISKSSLVTIYRMPIFFWFFYVNLSPFKLKNFELK